MPTPRTPRAIAAEARELSDTANRLFVPANMAKAMDLCVEFMESVASMTPPDEDHPAEPGLDAKAPAV